MELTLSTIELRALLRHLRARRTRICMELERRQDWMGHTPDAHCAVQVNDLSAELGELDGLIGTLWKRVNAF